MNINLTDEQAKYLKDVLSKRRDALTSDILSHIETEENRRHDDWYQGARSAAISKYEIPSKGTVEEITIDEDCAFCPHDEGCLVQAWLWVTNDEIEHSDVYEEG